MVDYLKLIFGFFLCAAGSHSLIKKHKDFRFLAFILVCCAVICLVIFADVGFALKVYKDLSAYETALNDQSAITLGEVLSSMSTILSVCCAAALAAMGYYYFGRKSDQ